jgi:hypothetical protein
MDSKIYHFWSILVCNHLGKKMSLKTWSWLKVIFKNSKLETQCIKFQNVVFIK